MVDLLTAEPEFSWAITRHLAHTGRVAEVEFMDSKNEQED
jgi:hypothetical protein